MFLIVVREYSYRPIFIVKNKSAIVTVTSDSNSEESWVNQDLSIK